MSSVRSAPVAIIGGGFSGTTLAAQLARRGVVSLLIEGGGRLARGAAYSTTEPVHLLNVRARNMSAFADDPDHFFRRFEALGGDQDGYAQRRFYGAYLEDILEEAKSTGLVTTIAGEAVLAERDGDVWKVVLADGRALDAAALVLAMGNEAPGGIAALAGLGERYVANPWGAEARNVMRAAADSGAAVLIVGTGLTMVDTVVSLDEAGFGGRIVALSRRGLSPRAHAPFEPAPVSLDDVPRGSVGAVLRWLRKRSAKVGWRAAVDSLRPHSHALWADLSLDEQRRFLRHARPWWDVHRHRIAPEIASRIAGLVADGRLEIMAGRVVAAACDDADHIQVEIARRGAATRAERFGTVINCTGPLHAMSRTANPLLRSLLDSGAARSDALDIGLEIEGDARVAGSDRLWAMSTLTKGRYWEITAVPDIRLQTAKIADAIAEELAE